MKPFKKIWGFARSHRAISVLIIVVVAFGGYRAIASLITPAPMTRYVLAVAETGTVVQSVTGTGQVSASNQVEVKPKVSGDLTAVPAVAGQSIRAGAILARIDSQDAQKAVRDAETALETAHLNYEKLMQPADALSLLQSQHALASAMESSVNASASLVKAYTDAFTAAANTYLDLPDAMSSLNDVLHSNSLTGGSQWNIDYYASAVHAADDSVGSMIRNQTDAAYQAARAAYEAAFTAYKATNRTADPATIEVLVAQTYDATIAVSDAVKSAVNLVQRFKDSVTQQNLRVPATADTHLSTLNSLTGTVNGHLSGLLNAQDSIKSAKSSIISVGRSISEKSASLDKLMAGADPLDVRSSKLIVQQREDALRDAQMALTDYTVRAPFDGVIAKVNAKKGDAASPGTAVATLITREQLATITLNEVDVSAISVGQKATVTFDAVPDLAVAGEVSSVDSLGTVSQGVVTYAVQIRFATQDNRVKSGMSVSAAIVAKAASDVVMVPAAAVKSLGVQNSVMVVSGTMPVSGTSNQGVALSVPPNQQTVKIGLSSDTAVEIVSGLQVGDVVVIRTIAPTTTSAATTQPSAASLLGGGGTRGVGGGGFGR
ncbi:MAG: efflux RND transporter periplasmic adaptor subunit [bacterium]|nr:efflux RND transporter periplasmic adaptor subunit [bacterium]